MLYHPIILHLIHAKQNWKKKKVSLSIWSWGVEGREKEIKKITEHVCKMFKRERIYTFLPQCNGHTYQVPTAAELNIQLLLAPSLSHSHLLFLWVSLSTFLSRYICVCVNFFFLNRTVDSLLSVLWSLKRSKGRKITKPLINWTLKLWQTVLIPWIYKPLRINKYWVGSRH